MNNWLNLGIAGTNLLKNKEAFSPIWYTCPAGKKTIGWGHVKEAGDKYTKISKETGDEILALDCKEVIDCIRKRVTFELNQSQFDALVVFAFNIGVNGFKASTLLRELNLGHIQKAADQFDAWNKITVNGKKVISKGLAIRRTEEKNLFLTK